MHEIVTPLIGALATAVGGALVAWFLARVRPGRFSRTLDQANKLIDFVERFAAVHNNLAKISDGKGDDLKKLMLEAAQAVRDDFKVERQALPDFERGTSSFRGALLLYLPSRPIIWPAYLVFHTLLIFMIYVAAKRTYEWWTGVGQGWRGDDLLALLIAVVGAALVRIAIYFLSKSPLRKEPGY